MFPILEVSLPFLRGLGEKGYLKGTAKVCSREFGIGIKKGIPFSRIETFT